MPVPNKSHLVPAKSVRIFVAGNSGTGKTTFAKEAILSRFPRAIIIDMTGEWEGEVDAEALNVSELQRAVKQLARERGKWKVSIALDPDELPMLVQWLIPVPRIADSPVRHLGGAVILVDEVDLLAPQGTAKEPIRTLYRRSRHAGLSVVSTTQRPANVSREVSAQSTHAAALRLSEPRDVEYMADLMRWSGDDTTRWQKWTRQYPHGGQYRNLLTGQVQWFGPHRWSMQSAGPDRSQLELLRDSADASALPA